MKDTVENTAKVNNALTQYEGIKHDVACIQDLTQDTFLTHFKEKKVITYCKPDGTALFQICTVKVTENCPRHIVFDCLNNRQYVLMRRAIFNKLMRFYNSFNSTATGELEIFLLNNMDKSKVVFQFNFKEYCKKTELPPTSQTAYRLYSDFKRMAFNNGFKFGVITAPGNIELIAEGMESDCLTPSEKEQIDGATC